MSVDAGNETGDGLTTISAEEYDRLRKQAEQAEALQQQVAEIDRLGKFIEAGFDPSNPTDEVFIKGYDGDLDLESIQAAATRAGWEFSQPEQQEAQPKGWDRTDVGGDAGATASGGMAQALQEAAQQATSQDDLNQRIADVYRAHGEVVASDQE